MKKIYLILPSGDLRFLGLATSLYDYLLEKKKKVIVPFHGRKDYSLVKNIYSKEHKQYVTYQAIANG